MTKQEFARQILQAVDNSRALDGASDEQVAQEITNLLDLLHPIDRERFAAWGIPAQRSTPAECW